MSTKRLSRTVIEGGRDSWSKYSRRKSHRDVRTKQRAFLSQVCNDPECADDGGVARRQPAWKSFADKLGPAERYLIEQLGRPWRKVEGEILARFDTRTIAGRHIVYDHLLPSDHESLYEGWRVHRRRFRVDGNGFLRLAPPRIYASRFRSKPDVSRALAWAKGRRVRGCGGALYWCEPTDSSAEAVLRRYRQTVRLSAEELAFYDKLSADERDAIRNPRG